MEAFSNELKSNLYIVCVLFGAEQVSHSWVYGLFITEKQLRLAVGRHTFRHRLIFVSVTSHKNFY